MCSKSHHFPAQAFKDFSHAYNKSSALHLGLRGTWSPPHNVTGVPQVFQIDPFTVLRMCQAHACLGAGGHGPRPHVCLLWLCWLSPHEGSAPTSPPDRLPWLPFWNRSLSPATLNPLALLYFSVLNFSPKSALQSRGVMSPHISRSAIMTRS